MAGGIRYRIAYEASPFRGSVERLTDAAQNMRPMMTIAGGIFENSTRHRFDTSRGPGGIPWKPTWRQRAGAVGPAGPVLSARILVNKGLLRGSIRSNVGDNFVETGVDGRSESAKYAKVHQFGATIRPKTARALMFTGPDGKFHMVQKVTIPARPFLGIDADDVTDLGDAFVVYLENVADGN